MATNYWTGSTSTVYTAANFSLAVIPADADTLIFGAANTKSCLSSVDRDADTAGAGLDLAKLLVQDGYTGDIGVEGGPLKIACGQTIFRGQGRFYLEASQGSGSADLDDVVLAGPGSVFLSDDGTEVITRIAILGGTASLAANMLATARLEIAQAAGLPVPKVTINASANAITEANIAAGNITCNRAITTYTQSGGTVTHGTGAFTTAYLFGGTLVYNSASTIPTLIIGAGATLDLRANDGMTITNLYRHPLGNILLPPDQALITVTTEYEYGGYTQLLKGVS